MPPSSAPKALPLLFGKPRITLGWQGYTTEIPNDWNPGKFSGNRATGELRVDDENGVRLELRWEEAKKTPDVQKSVSNFLDTLTKDAKKKKLTFQRIDDAKVVSRSKKRKDQVTNFGWTGDEKAQSPCGFGAAWFCPTCDRVTFAHVVGQAGEKPARIEKLAAEILGPLECHGEGGWDAWSLYDLRIEIPTEFELSRAQLLLNKLELEWVRPRPLGMYGWGRRAERLKLSRYPVANMLLARTTLQEWTDDNLRDKQKEIKYGEGEEVRVNGHEGVLYTGGPKDLRAAFTIAFFDRLMKRRTPKSALRAWNCEVSNRLWAFEHEVSAANEPAAVDVLDSLDCH